MYLCHGASKDAGWKTSRLNGSTGTWFPALANFFTPILRSTGNPGPMESWCFAIEKGLNTWWIFELQRRRCHSSWAGIFYTPLAFSNKNQEQFLCAALVHQLLSILCQCFASPNLPACSFLMLFRHPSGCLQHKSASILVFHQLGSSEKNTKIAYLHNPFVLGKDIHHHYFGSQFLYAIMCGLWKNHMDESRFMWFHIHITKTYRAY